MAQIPTRNISQFKSKMIGSGARPNLFEVDVTFPTGVNLAVQGDGTGQFDKENFRFLCKAAALPASTITPIPVPFRGRTLKVAGDRTFDVWTVTIINDEDFRLRHAFESWMNLLSKLDNATGATNPSSYMTDAFVYQLGRGAGTRFSERNVESDNGTAITPLRTYKFYDIFPTNVGEIALSYDNTDDIEEFTVDFQVQYWTAGESGDATQTIIS